jgi:hypothetical protein
VSHAANSIHLNFDDAWDSPSLPISTLDFRDWGPRLRYFAGAAALEKFDFQLPRPLPPFILYGSGDFHHLSGLWLQRAAATTSSGGQITLVSFDNHPDWDMRPPRWSCGGWINRALELAAVRRVNVWGCGNFELAFPARLFANNAALRDERLIIHPWAERYGQEVRKRFDCMSRDNWRYRFERFAAALKNVNVYITVDLDCVRCEEAATNWENGLFTAAEVAWAIGELRSRVNLVGGDLCGGYSPPKGSGMFRKVAMWWDHPRLRHPSVKEALRMNHTVFGTIWPALAG